MKLGMESYALRNAFGDEQAMKLISEAGFDCVDHSFYDMDDIPEFMSNTCEYALRLKSYMDKYNITCEQAHASYAMQYDMKFDISEPTYLGVVKGIEAASVVGAKNIVVHSITVPRNDQNIDYIEHNLAFFKSLEPYCEKFNIRIAIENLYVRDQKCNCYRGKLARPNEMCEFIKKLNSPWFCVCVDVSHAALTGIEPEDYISGMEKGLVKVLHLHDTDYIDDRHTVPFLGELNWFEIISALKKSGYNGNFSFEIITYLRHFPKELIPDALKFAHNVGRYLISEFEK